MDISSVVTDTELTREQAQWNLTGALTAQSPLQQFPIQGTRFQIGRRNDLNLCLPRPNVSKLHAEIINTNQMLFVRDLQSTNGTYVNGRRIYQDTPLAAGDILQFADAEFRVGRSESSSIQRTIASTPDQWQWAISSINALIDDRQVIPYFQPIVEMGSWRVMGYEVLARSTLPGLKNPREMFQAAALLGMEAKLSELSREMGLLASEPIVPPAALFLNTHPSEHDGWGLIQSLERLVSLRPNVEIVLELHEGAISDLNQMRQLRDELRRLHIRLAFDDFGAGQSRLVELTEVAPDFVKFDLGLIRDIHTSAPRQQLLEGFLKLSRDLGIVTLAEGIESAAEAETCRQLGFDLGQGYLFGRPAAIENILNDSTELPANGHQA